jgi:hypothetical protein
MPISSPTTYTMLQTQFGYAAMQQDASNSHNRDTSATIHIPYGINPKGVANILSLYNVTKHYRVTMDSPKDPTITVHKNDGDHDIRFTPSRTHGLFKYELPEDQSSINQMWSMATGIPTVADKNAMKYTKRAY